MTGSLPLSKKTPTATPVLRPDLLLIVMGTVNVILATVTLKDTTVNLAKGHT